MITWPFLLLNRQRGIDILWVDDRHALALFSSPITGQSDKLGPLVAFQQVFLSDRKQRRPWLPSYLLGLFFNTLTYKPFEIFMVYKVSELNACSKTVAFAFSLVGSGLFFQQDFPS